MSRARDLSRLGNAGFGINGTNLGIGTTAATSALTVRGDSFITGIVTAGLFASLFMLIIVSVSDYVLAAAWSPIDYQTFHKVFGLLLLLDCFFSYVL